MGVIDNDAAVAAASPRSGRSVASTIAAGEHKMTDSPKSSPKPEAAIPVDDLQRRLTVAYPGSPKMRHVSIAGDTYTILVSGVETAGRYCLIDMHVPAGGGPPPHRHNFEEMLTLRASLNSPSRVRHPLSTRDPP
jgi:hypothetical protein